MSIPAGTGRAPLYRIVSALAALLVACLLLVGAAGCGSSQTAQNQKQTTSSAKKPVTSAPSLKKKQGTKKAAPQKSTTDNAAGTSAQTSSQRGAMCSTDELSATLSFGAGAGAGSSYPYLVLTNTGKRTCLERGYPGVSLQAGGKQIGAAANRDTSVAPVSVQLKPGESAHSELQIVNADNIDASSCSPKQADSVLVFPPDQTQSIRISTTDYTGCQNLSTSIIRVRPLEPGK